MANHRAIVFLHFHVFVGFPSSLRIHLHTILIHIGTPFQLFYLSVSGGALCIRWRVDSNSTANWTELVSPLKFPPTKLTERNHHQHHCSRAAGYTFARCKFPTFISLAEDKVQESPNLLYPFILSVHVSVFLSQSFSHTRLISKCP